MIRRVAYLTVVASIAALLAGCAMNFISGGEQRASWREVAEQSCMESRQDSPFVVAAKEIDGRGACGITHPLQISAFAAGYIAVTPTAEVGCPIADAVDRWLRESVEPAAMAWFGQSVTGIKQIDDYTCRTRNSVHGAKMSEHAYGNALDVAGFILEDGTTVLVRTGWRGTAPQRGFLREVEATACQRFSTVLGPGAPYHGDHFHVDLARRSQSGRSFCDPKPQVVPPDRGPYTPVRNAGLTDPNDPGYTGSIMRAQVQ